MNYKIIARFISMILAIEAGFLCLPIVWAIIDKELQVIVSFLISAAAAGLLAFVLWLVSRNASRTYFAKEGMVCVGLSWIAISLCGALPFVLSGQIPNFLNALFEIVSGFTTTGASILTAVEGMSRAILFWRSFSHWLGGMGVLVFLLAIIPNNSRDSGLSMHLMRAESPGPSVSKLVPKLRQSAMILYLIYMALTVLDIIFLVFDMSFFEAVCTAFGTAGTGGFGIRNDSLASHSPYVQIVTTVFMTLFGINFACYYLLLMRKIKNVLKDEELRFYILFILISSGVIAVNIHSLYDSWGEAIRHSSFQVASVMTTTGFATADFNLWPTLSKCILLALMVIGSCAGSTGGGFKCFRILLIAKTAKRNLQQILHPQRIKLIRINGQVVDEKIIAGTGAYLGIYCFILLISTVLVGIDGGQSVLTSFTSVIACLNNIGPGLDAVGPTGNYAALAPLSKVVLIFDMLAGRLEIYPVLLLFSINTWRRKS